MRIILIIAVIIAAFFLFAILTIIKDQLEEYKKIRDEDNQRKQYWSKVDYYKKRMKHPFCEGLASVNIDGKYGYINEYYDVVIQPQYDDAGSFYNGTALVKKRGMECVIDKTGKVIIIAFDEIYGFVDDNRVRSGNKWGYVDKAEWRIIKPQFDDIHTFSESLAGIRIGEKWGFIDRSGKIVISPQFDDVGGFCEGLCKVKIGKKWGFIDRSGEIIISPQFNEALYFSENLCGVKVGNKWGFIDRSGKRIIKPQFEETSEFRKSFASVKINNKWGVINASGNYIIDPILEKAPNLADLSEGYGIVKKEGAYWYINKKGKMIRFEDAGRWWFKEDLAAVKINGLWGYIDKKGSFVINPQFTKAFDFDYGGFAIVEKDNMLMVINKKGKTVVRASDFSCYINSRYYNYQYKMFMYDFHEGLSRIKLSRDEPEMKKGMVVSYSDVVYMDNKGKIAIRPDCEDGYCCGDFSEGLAPVSEIIEGDYGYINKSGKYIIEPAFEYACSFSEGLAKIVKDKKSCGRYTYIDKVGEEVIKTKFWSAEDFSGGMALVSIKLKDDVIKYGYINKQGYSAFEL